MTWPVSLWALLWFLCAPMHGALILRLNSSRLGWEHLPSFRVRNVEHLDSVSVTVPTGTLTFPCGHRDHNRVTGWGHFPSSSVIANPQVPSGDRTVLFKQSVRDGALLWSVMDRPKLFTDWDVLCVHSHFKQIRIYIKQTWYTFTVKSV